MKKISLFLTLVIGMLFGTIVYAEGTSEAFPKDWVSELKLSTISQNVIYRYTATGTVQFPEIINDTGKNVLVYLKEKDGGYDSEVYPMKTIESNALSASDNEYLSGEAFNIYYKEITNTEFLNKVDASDVIKLSSYSDGDELSYQFEKYIYNDTTADITLTVTNGTTNPTVTTVTVPKDTIYGFDWMITSVTVGNNTGNTQDPTPEDTPDDVPDTTPAGGSGNYVEDPAAGNGNNNNNNANENEEENPTTGLSLSIVVIAGLLIVASVLLVVSERNKVYKSI